MALAGLSAEGQSVSAALPVDVATIQSAGVLDFARAAVQARERAAGWVIAEVERPFALALGGLLAWVLTRHEIGKPSPVLPVDLLRIPIFALSIATSIASFMVRDDRDITQLYQRDPASPDPVQRSNSYQGPISISAGGQMT